MIVQLRIDIDEPRFFLSISLRESVFINGLKLHSYSSSRSGAQNSTFISRAK